MKLNIITTAALTLALGGCQLGPEAETTMTEAGPVQTLVAKEGDIVFNYSANGKTYKVHSRYDRILRAYGTSLTVLSGAPFTGAPSEDAEAQNTMRDAFRSQGICKDGQHPGLLQFGYGYSAEYNSWGGKIRCSDKNQVNI